MCQPPQTFREIQLQMDQEKLNTFGLSVAEVANQFREVNQDVPAGKLQTKESQISVRTAGSFHDIQQFDSVIVAERDNMPIVIVNLLPSCFRCRWP